MTVRELVTAHAGTEEELREGRDPARVCAPREEYPRRRIDTLAVRAWIIRELQARRQVQRIPARAADRGSGFPAP